MAYTINDTTREVIDKAKKAGFDVFETSPFTLLLDIDKESDLEHYAELYPLAQQLCRVREINRWKSKDGGTHIVLESEDYLSAWTRLILQACLGSDRKRELLGLNLFNQNAAACFSFLFKPKENK